MKKRISIVLTTIAIIFGVFIYYGSLTKANNETDSTIIIDKDGEVVEPLSGDNDNRGH